MRAALGLRDGLELEFLWTSTLETRTKSTSGLLHDLDILSGLLSLDAMHQSWSYAWASCPHHQPNQATCTTGSKFRLDTQELAWSRCARVDIPGGDGERTLAEAIHGYILWDKRYIVLKSDD